MPVSALTRWKKLLSVTIKVVYLAINDASKKWTMPIRNWRTALNRFMIEFEGRLTDYGEPGRLHRIIYRLRLFGPKALI